MSRISVFINGEDLKRENKPFSRLGIDWLMNSNTNAIYSELLVACFQEDLEKDIDYKFFGQYMNTVKGLVGVEPVIRFFSIDEAKEENVTKGLLAAATGDWIAFVDPLDIPLYDYAWDAKFMEIVLEQELNSAQAHVITYGNMVVVSRGAIEFLASKDCLPGPITSYIRTFEFLAIDPDLIRLGRVRSIGQITNDFGVLPPMLQEQKTKIVQKLKKRIGVGY